MNIDWDKVAQGVNTFVTAAAPFVDAGIAAFAPEAAVAVSLGEKIITGVMAEEPAAKALYNQISSGTPPTPDQLQELEANYEADYQKTKADIAVQIAAKGGG